MNERWAQHPAFQDILGSIRKVRVVQVAVGCVLAVLLLCVLWFLVGWYKIIPFIGLVAVVWGVYRLFQRGASHQSPLIQLLVEEPDRIVWIYGYQLTRAPLGIVLSRQHRIFFQTNDQKSYSLDIPASRYLVVMKWLNRALPNAAFGWDDGRYQRWLMDGSV